MDLINIQAKWTFNSTSFFEIFSNICIIRMNLDLMVFSLHIICLKKIKEGAHVINLDEHANIGTHWIALYIFKMKLFILIDLELNTCLKKLNVLL